MMISGRQYWWGKGCCTQLEVDNILSRCFVVYPGQLKDSCTYFGLFLSFSFFLQSLCPKLELCSPISSVNMFVVKVMAINFDN